MASMGGQTLVICQSERARWNSSVWSAKSPQDNLVEPQAPLLFLFIFFLFYYDQIEEVGSSLLSEFPSSFFYFFSKT